MKKIWLIILLCTSLAAELPTIFPPAIKKGDLIALVFPASFFNKDDDEAQKILKLKSKWLQQQGYRTIFYPEKIHRSGYLAGTDNERAEALMNAWKNEKIKAIWCFRGGYGSQRILDSLDYELIKNHPKILIGMSDITALHQAIQQKTGLVTFLAPVLNYFNEKKNDFDDGYAFSSLEQVLSHQMSGEISLPLEFNLEILKPGKATGKLVGGNLSIISSLCGTKWQLNTEGKILILEDVNEETYAIDRMLWQLKESNLLDRPAAVILASWVDCNSSEYGFKLEEVFNRYFGNATYPVIKGFPCGHDKYQITLPLNNIIEIDTSRKTVQILNSSVIVDTKKETLQ
ncbi:MAG: LD-carboxypeptidase [Parachlamydiales bacterium]|nr:LD-carboxypeptidase [Parachlamydiales bacterium]